MATNTLNLRILICNDTTANWGTSDKVLLKGEMGIEFTSGAPKFKFGNGTDTWAELPYVTMTPEEITTAINNAITVASHSHSNKSILDAITASFTTALKTNYDGAYTHSQAAHAPSNAQANVIESVKVNGTAQTVTSKAVDITVPTKTSQLTNDSGFKTTDNNTTYDLSASISSANGNVKLNLTGSDSTTDSVTVKGAGSVSVTTDASGVVTVTGTDTKYNHPNSGVTAGTYKSVTVDAQGHVTSGTNPTTLSGYGITDAYTSTVVDQKIASAVAGASHLKKEIVTSVPSASQAQENVIYMIKDTSAVGSDKYKEYMLIGGEVVQTGDTSVDLTNYATKTEVNNAKTDAATDATTKANNALASAKSYADGLASNYATAAQGAKADTAVQSVKIGTTEYKTGTNVVLPAYPTTLPASDVSAWAKAATKPTYTKAEVGLGNVTNDKQIKGLASGTTENHVVTFGADGYTVKDSGYTIASNVPANAKFTDTTYLDMKGATASAAGAHGLVPAPATGDQGKFLTGAGTWAVPTDTVTRVKGSSESTYRTGDVNITAANIGLGNVNNTADSAKSVASAAKLTNARTFSITGGATASATSFDGTANVALNVTSVNAMNINIASGDTLILNGGSASA